MKARQYAGIWELLSEASRDAIADETRKAIRGSTGKELPEPEIRKDFSEGGPIARGYWDAFLTHFDPDEVLERSRWEEGPIGGGRAEILITSRTSEKPARLSLYRENSGWKVGLVETFRRRKP